LSPNGRDRHLEAATIARMARIGVSDVSFELFNATHMGIDYRYSQSLAYLAKRLR
jgi:hypothetical protein